MGQTLSPHLKQKPNLRRLTSIDPPQRSKVRVATDGQTRPDQERESVDISHSHYRTDLDGWLDETETYICKYKNFYDADLILLQYPRLSFKAVWFFWQWSQCNDRKQFIELEEYMIYKHWCPVQLLFPLCGPLSRPVGGDGWLPRVLCVSGSELLIAVTVGFSLHLLVCPWKHNWMDHRKWPQPLF